MNVMSPHHACLYAIDTLLCVIRSAPANVAVVVKEMLLNPTTMWNLCLMLNVIALDPLLVGLPLPSPQLEHNVWCLFV